MGGYSYSREWSNAAQSRSYTSSGYSMITDSSKYAKYDKDEKLENDGLKELVKQYLNLKINYINHRLNDSNFNIFLELILKLLNRFKYLGIMDSGMPKCNLEFDSPDDLLSQLSAVIQWIDEVLKYFGYFGLDKGKNDEESSIRTLNEANITKTVGVLAKIRQFRLNGKRNINEYER